MVTLLPRGARHTANRLASFAEALLTPHGMDRYLELANPMLVRHQVRGVVTEAHRQTADTVTLAIRPSSGWRGFQAGQHVRVSVDIDGVRRTRCYSPACSQWRADTTLELTVKADPHGLVSRHLVQHATRGMMLGLSEAQGEFTLPSPRPEQVLLISGGSGITPVMAMARTLLDEANPPDIVFVHYAKTPDTALYADELRVLAHRHPRLRVLFAYTHAGEGGDLHGHFCDEHLRAAAPEFATARTYLCGPRPLMDAVREVFASEQISEQLHTEEFTPPAIPIDPSAASGRVRFTRSGTEIDNSGKPLLEQAEDAGLEPEHGCRMGICFSCTQTKNTGCVRNAQSGEISTEDNEEIQLCISVPVGDVDIAR